MDPSLMEVECLLMWIVRFGTIPGMIIFLHLLKAGTITHDTMSTEGWLCHSQHSCNEIV